MRFLRETNIDFIGYRWWALGLSGLVTLIGIGHVIVSGGLRESIDFAGGSVLQYRFPQAVAAEDIRDVLASLGEAQAEIQRFGGPDEMLIRIPNTGNADLVDNVKSELGAKFPGVELRRQDSVGPKVGKELRTAAFNSILFSLLCILVYVSMRFEFRFAVGAVVALAHDVIVTVGALSLANREMSLVTIAALLTIVGYSVMDTIVVYDRIRENMRVPGREPFDKVLNKSITSGTVLMSTVVLMVFGGKVLWDFAFALTVGVTAGTYSSEFIAAPLVYEWERRWPRRVKGAPRPGATVGSAS